MSVESTDVSVGADERPEYKSRTERRLRTRDKLYEAAMAEFARSGFVGSQIEDIIKAAGVARGTFYNHFATKDHVLLEYIERLQQAAAMRMAELEVKSARSFFRHVVDTLVEVVAGEDPVILREALCVISRHADHMENVAPLYTGLTGFFESAQARGEIRSDFMPGELAVAFLPGVFGLLLLRLGAPESELRTTLHQAVDVFVRGIAP